MAEDFRNVEKNKELASQLIDVLKCSRTEAEVQAILRSTANKIGSYSKAGIARWSQRGYLKYDNGDVYVGGFKVKKSGQGSYEFTSGDKKHGEGLYTFASGAVYEGGYKDDQRHGKGKYTSASGAVYEGGYKDDQRHGKGMYTSAEGAVSIGKWESGIYQEEEGEEEKSEMSEGGLKDDKDNQRKKRDMNRINSKNKRDRDKDKLARLNKKIAVLKSQIKELITAVGHPHLSSSIVGREQAKEDIAEEGKAEEKKTEELPTDPNERKNALQRKGRKRKRQALEASWKLASEEILDLECKLLLLKSQANDDHDYSIDMKNSDAKSEDNDDSDHKTDSNDNGLRLKKRKT